MAKKSNSTESFVEIEEIRGPVMILKDGSLRVIVEAHSINFELKSSDEKIGIISGFQNFLNAVDFPLQIVIDSRKLDIKPYLQTLETNTAQLNNELLRVQAVEYARFVKGLAELSNVVAKKFYVVVPYYASELTLGKTSILGKIKATFKPSSTKRLDDADLQKYIIQLDQRTSVIRSGIESLGVKTSVLEEEELINIYYAYYNPRPI